MSRLAIVLVVKCAVILGTTCAVTANDETMELNCMGTNVTGTFNSTYIQGLFPSVSSWTMYFVDTEMVMINDSCQLGEDDDFVLDQSFAQCSSSVESLAATSTLRVNYTVLVIAEASNPVVISRDRMPVLQFTCEYLANVVIALQSDIAPEIRNLAIAASQGVGKFNVVLQRYTTANFQTIDTSDRVTVNEPVYMQLTAVDSIGDLIVQLDDCWVTPSDNSSGSDRYDVVDDGCAARDDWWQESNTVIMTHATSDARFSFASFEWTEEYSQQALYIHCIAKICANNTEICTNPPVCSSARRRRSSSENPDTEPDYRRVSLGPLHMEPAGCENMRCEHRCEIVDWSPKCSCRPDFVLTSDGRSCVSVGNRPTDTGVKHSTGSRKESNQKHPIQRKSNQQQPVQPNDIVKNQPVQEVVYVYQINLCSCMGLVIILIFLLFFIKSRSQRRIGTFEEPSKLSKI